MWAPGFLARRGTPSAHDSHGRADRLALRRRRVPAQKLVTRRLRHADSDVSLPANVRALPRVAERRAWRADGERGALLAKTAH